MNPNHHSNPNLRPNLKPKKKLRRHNLSLVALVATFSLSAIAFCLGLSNVNQKLGTVDMQALLLEQSQQLAKRYPTGKVPQGVMQQVVVNIKAMIADYGQSQQIILLAKGAVLSETLPDYTAILKTRLNQQATIHNYPTLRQP